MYRTADKIEKVLWQKPVPCKARSAAFSRAVAKQIANIIDKLKKCEPFLNVLKSYILERQKYNGQMLLKTY